MSCGYKKTNLKTETLNVLSDFNLTESDVLWIGGSDFSIPVARFWELAENTDYDFGFGNQNIASDLTIVCDGGYLIRRAYEGCEWWKFTETPKRPPTEIDVTSLSVDVDGDFPSGKTLKEINESSQPEPSEEIEG